MRRIHSISSIQHLLLCVLGESILLSAAPFSPLVCDVKSGTHGVLPTREEHKPAGHRCLEERN